MNSSSTIFDYIIIGGGLSGSILAYTFSEKFNKKVKLIDNNLYQSSSVAAAGIYNPVTGKRFSKTWLADDIFPFLHDFYEEAETRFNSRFIYPYKIFKPFDNISEQNFWVGQSADPAYKKYIQIVFKNPSLEGKAKCELGGIETSQSGFLDVGLFLENIKSYLLEKGFYATGRVDVDKIEIKENEIIILQDDYSYRAEKIIFAEGFQASGNKLWQWLPWSLNKGELLVIGNKQLTLPYILNKGVFVCPTPIAGKFKAGSTYQWDKLDETPTEEAKNEIIEKLHTYFCADYTIENQLTGIRPAVSDRKPFIGAHPTIPQFFIFNGFGSKAVSLAPYFASQLAGFLVNDEQLTPEADIKRFYQLFK